MATAVIFVVVPPPVIPPVSAGFVKSVTHLFASNANQKKKVFLSTMSKEMTTKMMMMTKMTTLPWIMLKRK